MYVCYPVVCAAAVRVARTCSEAITGEDRFEVAVERCGVLDVLVDRKHVGTFNRRSVFVAEPDFECYLKMLHRPIIGA